MNKLYPLFALSVFVSAQSTSSTPSPPGTIPRCVQDCLSQIASFAPGPCDPQAICFCSGAFDTVVGPCISTSCSAADQAAVASIQQSQCSGGSASDSGTNTPTGTFPTAGSQSPISTIRTAGTSQSTTSRSTSTPNASTSTSPAAATGTAGTSTASAGSAAANTNAAALDTVQGAWVVAAGLFGVAIAL